MTEPLKQEILDQFVALRKEAGSLEDKLSNRLDYIIRHTFKQFGVTISYWYVDGADEGDGGDLMRCFRWGDDVVSMLCISWNNDSVDPNDMCIIDQDGNEFGFAEGEIPRRWLFEPFEAELEAGIVAYKEKKEAAKEKRRQARLKKKSEKDKLKASAASKLTKAERKALGL